MDSASQFFKGADELLPCQRIDGFAVLGNLFAVDFGHTILPPPFVILEPLALEYLGRFSRGIL